MTTLNDHLDAIRSLSDLQSAQIATLTTERDALAKELAAIKAEKPDVPGPVKLATPSAPTVSDLKLTGFRATVTAVAGASEYNWGIRTKGHTKTWYVRTAGPTLTYAGENMPNWELWVSVRAGMDGATQSDPSPETYFQLPANGPSVSDIFIPPDGYTGEVFTKTIDLDGAKNRRFTKCTIQDIAGKWPFSNGVYGRNLDGIWFDTCLFRNIPHQAIEGYGWRNGGIVKCQFVDCWEPIHILNGMVNFEVSDCFMTRCTRIGIELQGDGDNIRVLRNTVQDHARVYADSFGLSIATVEAKNVLIQGNAVLANMPNNPNAADSLGWERADILTNPGRYGMGIEAAGGKNGGTLRVLDNIIRGRWVTPISVLLSKADIRGNMICGMSTIWPGAKNGVTGDNSGLASNPRAVSAGWNADFAAVNSVKALCAA